MSFGCYSLKHSSDFNVPFRVKTSSDTPYRLVPPPPYHHLLCLQDPIIAWPSRSLRVKLSHGGRGTTVS